MNSKSGGKLLILVFSVVIAVIVLVTASWVMLAPRILEKAIKQAVLNNCPNCDLQIERLVTPVLHPGQILAEGLHLTGGTHGAFEVELKIARVQVLLNLKQISKHVIELQDLEIFQPNLVIKEGDKTHPHHPDDNDESKYKLRILHTHINQGYFKYIRARAGKPAIIQIEKIAGLIKEFGTTNELIDAATASQLDGQIERSGQVTLRVHAKFFKQPLHADIDFDMVGQNLEDFTPFFKDNDGVSLKGQLIKGRSHSEIRGKKLSTIVHADYKGLEVHLDPSIDRSPTGAFFMNLGAAVALKKSDTKAPPENKIEAVQLEREQKESVVHFVLRGVKEAALKVAKGV